MSGLFKDGFDARSFWTGFLMFGAVNLLLMVVLDNLLPTPAAAHPGLAFLAVIASTALVMCLVGPKARQAAAGLVAGYAFMHLASGGVCTLSPGKAATHGDPIGGAALFVVAVVAGRLLLWTRE